MVVELFSDSDFDFAVLLLSVFVGRLNSTNENDQHYKNNNNDVVDQVDSGCIAADGAGGGGGGGTAAVRHVVTPEEMTEASAAKRHSLRSTSSFCDEVFLEELTNMGGLTSLYSSSTAAVGGCGAISDSDDALSYGALSLGALSCSNAGGGSLAAQHYTTSTGAVNSIVGFDEGKFIVVY